MSNITWANKDKSILDGVTNKFLDSDANEVKTAVNSKDELAAGNRLVRYASCILRCDNNTTPSNPFTWTLLNDSQHEPLFFTGVSASSGSLVVTYPACAQVMGFSVTTDETLAKAGIYCGASVGLSSAIIDAYMNFGTYGGYLRGTGTGTFFTANEDIASFSTSFVSASEFLFNPPKPYGGTDASYGDLWRDATAVYAGPNDYHCQRLFTGLGSYAFRFQIVDNTGTPIATNTTDDVVMITTTMAKNVKLDLEENDTNGFPGATNIINNGSNFWVSGLFLLAS